MRSVELNGRLALLSYVEPIAAWRGEHDLVVELDWKYSQTTNSHRRLLVRLADEQGLTLKKVTREQIRALAGLDPAASPPRL